MHQNQNVSLTLQAFLPSTSGSGISRASFGAFVGRNAKPLDFMSAISRLFKNAVTVVPGTLQVSASGANAQVTACLRAVRPARAVEIDEAGRTPGFTMVSKNLYMDMKDRTQWGLQRDGDKTVLVRNGDLESDEALNKIMSAMVSTSGNQIRKKNELQAAVDQNTTDLDTGILVAYMQKGGAVKLGYSLSKAVAGDNGPTVEVVPVHGPVESISTSAVIRAYGTDDYPELVLPPMVSKSGFADGNPTKKDIIDYYRSIFGYNDPFFSQFEKSLTAMS